MKFYAILISHISLLYFHYNYLLYFETRDLVAETVKCVLFNKRFI